MNEELLKALKEKKDAWPLLQESQPDQTIWFQQMIIPQIVRVLLSDDEVDEVIVLEDLAPAAQEAFSNPSISLDLLVNLAPQFSAQAEDLKEKLEAFIPNIPIKAEIVDKLVNPMVLNLDPEILFVRIVTASVKERGYIDYWDQQIGFSRSLGERGIPVKFSYDQRKLLFGLAHLLFALNDQKSKVVTAAQAGTSGGHLIKPGSR